MYRFKTVVFCLTVSSFVGLTNCTSDLSTIPSTDSGSPSTPNPDPITPSGFYEWGVFASQYAFLSGHSLMDNPIGDFLSLIANDENQDFQWNQHIVIGSPLRFRVHANAYSGFQGWINSGKSKTGQTINNIAEVRNPTTIGTNNRYNALIVTENHNYHGMALYEDSIRYLKLYSDFYNSANPSRIFYYHSWLSLDKSNPTSWLNYEKAALKMWECNVSRVNDSYINSSSNIRVLNLPAGTALADLIEQAIAGNINGISGSMNQITNSLIADNVHTTTLGSYYMGLLQYIALYGVKPNNLKLPPNYNLSGISLETLNHLASHAWNFLHNYYTSGIKQHSINQCRTYAAEFCAQAEVHTQHLRDHIQDPPDLINNTNCREALNSNVFSPTEPDWFSLPQ